MTSRRRMGDRAENLAVSYLSGLGYSVIDRNWSCRMGELDVVVERDNLLVFVEVRSTGTGFLPGPELTVTTRKQARVARAAEIFLSQRALSHTDIRFDVLGISGAGTGPRSIEHIEDAFVPSWAI